MNRYEDARAIRAEMERIHADFAGRPNTEANRAALAMAVKACISRFIPEPEIRVYSDRDTVHIATDPLTDAWLRRISEVSE